MRAHVRWGHSGGALPALDPWRLEVFQAGHGRVGKAPAARHPCV